MSVTKIPEKVKFFVWLKAGGRCQYPGCNIPLWRDDLTLQIMNRAYLAHIIGDKPDGPRGDSNLSDKLKADPSNIMLLCDTHHRLVDRDQREQHPADLLQIFKREHEERIERQTAIHASMRTHILLLGTKIGDRRGKVNFEEAREAIKPERYPATESGIRIDLDHLHLNENDPEFWTFSYKQIDRTLERLLDSGSEFSEPVNHLSIFALAPIPVLIYFGKKLGDLVSADIYQRHRSPGGWKWQELSDETFDYSVSGPAKLEKCEQVAIVLSLSGKIHAEEIEQAVGRKLPTYDFTIPYPNVTFLMAKEQLELFRKHWRMLLSKIRESHGIGCEVHIFPAVPAPIAIEMGRAILPHVDPKMVIYNKVDKKEFKQILEI